MNTVRLATLIAGGLITAILGLAAPASADIGHNHWVTQMSSESIAAAHH